MISDLQRHKLVYFFDLLDLNRNELLQFNDFSDLAEKVRLKLGHDEGSKEHKKIADRSIHLFHQLLTDISPAEHQSITKDEWLKYFDGELGDNLNDEVLQTYQELIYQCVFDFFDQNHDGFINRDEYQMFFEVFGADEQYMNESFELLDSNGDQKISRYEMMAAIEDFLISDDTNSSGNWAFGNWESAPK